MRGLVLQTGVSIDGFVARPDGAHDWGYEREDPATKDWKLASVREAGAHDRRLAGDTDRERRPRRGHRGPEAGAGRDPRLPAAFKVTGTRL